jgi:hypothetical protein
MKKRLMMALASGALVGAMLPGVTAADTPTYTSVVTRLGPGYPLLSGSGDMPRLGSDVSYRASEDPTDVPRPSPVPPGTGL